jgi:hypothetical protein
VTGQGSARAALARIPLSAFQVAADQQGDTRSIVPSNPGIGD